MLQKALKAGFLLLAMLMLAACASKTLPVGLQLYDSNGTPAKVLTTEEAARATGVTNDVTTLEGFGKVLIFPPPDSGSLDETPYWYKLSDLTAMESTNADKGGGTADTNFATETLGKVGNWFNTLSVDTIVPVTAWGWWLFVIVFGVIFALFVAIPVAKDQDGFNLSYQVLGWTRDKAQMGPVLGIYISPSPTLGDLRRRLNFAGKTEMAHGQINYDVKKIVGATDELVRGAVNTEVGNLSPDEVGTLQSNTEALARIRRAIADTFRQITGFQVLEITVPTVKDTMGVLSAKSTAQADADKLGAPVQRLIQLGVDPDQAARTTASQLRSDAIGRMGRGATPVIDVEGEEKE